MKVIFTIGLPASGKSTWARDYCIKNKDWVRVNRDDLRYMRGEYWVPKDELLITQWETLCIIEALGYGKNVIVDATNLNPVYLSRIKSKISLAFSNTEFEEKVFDTPVEECIKRDLQRHNSVGEKVIRMFYNKYYKQDMKIIQDEGLPHSIIVDLDGTVCIHNGRSPFDYKKCDTDLPNKPIIKIVENYLSYGRGTIIFMSGREASCRGKSIEWIMKHICLTRKEFQLFMRTETDNRKDSIVKKELFDKFVRDKYYIDFILDDRSQVVSLWRDMGLTCLQVDEGNF